MKKMFTIIGITVALLAIVFLVYKSFAYINQGGYVIDNGKVLYKFWNEANGWQSSSLEDVDLASFKILNDPHYASDKNHIFYKGGVVTDVDPATFEILSAEYMKDSKNVFFQNSIFENVDPGSFVVIGDKYSKDRKDAYFQTYIMHACDPSSLVVLGLKNGQYWAKDSKCFYANGEKVPASDYESQ